MTNETFFLVLLCYCSGVISTLLIEYFCDKMPETLDEAIDKIAELRAVIVNLETALMDLSEQTQGVAGLNQTKETLHYTTEQTLTAIGVITDEYKEQVLNGGNK